ncbi:hypothetical protein [Lactobacillus kefiranofaciens]|uniref:hypothetical protein n=2 Tax=Lactobacillus TaxID=1578 RepID=UPI0006EEF163|nr:hypothetical protein [Lactobacillus kefiranofaciens]KRL23783.1 hypothetical protein FC94_GL001777 [Lactobacillus kefiranofaciens subsp. kefirgranum DSM 10550 = JCM 8572]MCJ2171289.1 hypothetical protein [Lactobacillus kefiranofaciens]PAK98272.1 hypothetical protein B8W86_05800 [Lactobacillus kefiranofaciens]QNT43294.1 hypothetical protein ICI50_05330 [Lactobacillus kefiranofaciens]
MDYLSRKKEYIFLNNRKALVRVHVKQVSKQPYNIWVEGKSKNYRDCVALLNRTLVKFDPQLVPPIVVVSNKKLGNGAISSYAFEDNVIFFNNFYHSTEQIDEITHQNLFIATDLNLFIATDLKEIIRHELGHKLHWDAIKRFYRSHKKQYNNLQEAKNDFDSNLESYITHQLNNNYSYLIENVSTYANLAFEYAKANYKNNSVNEVIAEVYAIHGSKDPILNDLIMEELNYGRKH